MRPLSIPISLVSLACIVTCLPQDSPLNVFDINPIPDSPNAVADMTPSIPSTEPDLFSDANESPMLMSSISTDLNDHADSSLLNDAVVNADPIDAGVDTTSDTSSQLAENPPQLLCPGKNRFLYCCPVHGTWVGCIYFNGEPWGICSRKNQYCCALNLETKDPYDCEQVYPSILDHIEDFLRGIGGPGGELAPGGGGGFFPIPDLN